MSNEIENQELEATLQPDTQTVQDNQEQDNLGQNNAGQDTATKEESYQARNFRELREKAKQAERERDELRSYIEQQKKAEAKPASAAEEDDDFGINEDDIVEGRELKKYHKKQREQEKKLKHFEQQFASMSVEMQLRTKYPDFDTVVNDTTVQRFKEEYPDMFNTIQTSSNLYSKAATAYSLIKQFNLDKAPDYSHDKKTMAKNQQKPKSAAAIIPTTADHALSGANAFANGLTDELKERMRKMNRDAIKKQF